MRMMRALRRRLLTPDVSETLFDVRGFHVKTPQARERLETAARFFVTGYATAAEAARPAAAERGLEEIPADFRGFAYEGAAMGFAVRDGLPLGGRRHVAEFLDGAAGAHIYMAYVGVGWAMARLPRMRWSALYAPDPLLRWLALDGYGFHQAYFKTRRYVHEQYQQPEFPWPVGALSWYANQVIDQGIGRATWFVGCADPVLVARIFETFPEHRRADLYSGAGLAATYAGAADRDELCRFWELAGPYRPQVAQGAAFAAAARLRAGLVTPHNEVATDVFCAMPVEEATKVTDEARVALPHSGDLPAYAVWRQRISDAYVSLGHCS